VSAACSDLQPEREAVQYACHTGLCVCCYVIVCESMTVEAPGNVPAYSPHQNWWCIYTETETIVCIIGYQFVQLASISG